jgi:tetratricopeptide (TPR) repeat protein
MSASTTVLGVSPVATTAANNSANDSRTKYLPWALSAIALAYAVFAGLRTVSDPDLGWQLATGRWILQHRAIPYTDVLSYTSNQGAWIYPVLSQIIFYCTYLVGGYALLSWMSAAVCVGTTALFLRGNNVSKVLAVIAVPIVAIRTAPRAELFTTLLFATFVSLLWEHHRSRHTPLWLLPPLMVLCVNSHQGFISGLGMCAAYIFLEVGELIVPELRTGAISRMRKASPWLVATLLATVVNPWGIRNYLGMAQLVPVHSSGWIMELAPMRLSSSLILEQLGWRDPYSSFWWLVGIVIIAVVAALVQRRFAAAIILAVAIYFPFHTVRLQGPFSTVAVVIGGSVLYDAARSARALQLWRSMQAKRIACVTLASVLALSLFAGLRSWDLFTNRAYLKSSVQLSLFGPGVSFWYPEEAAQFVRQEAFPKNLFNDYTAGGFVTWRLSPEYPDYIDGRGNAGPGLMFKAFELLNASLDSDRWKQEAESKGINTIFTSVDPAFGGGTQSLSQFCQSKNWRLAYLDAKASVFVRSTPQTEGLTHKFPSGCAAVRFDNPPNGNSARAVGERFIYLRNAAAILLALDRPQEALEKATLGERISAENPDIHFLKGIAFFHLSNYAEAEKELKISISLERGEKNSQSLASLYRQQGRFVEALDILNRQIERSDRPHQLHLMKGFVQIDLERPLEALDSFNEAEQEDPFQAEAASLGSVFKSQLAQGRANAWWKLTADYERRGLEAKALQARQQAETFENLADTTVSH